MPLEITRIPDGFKCKVTTPYWTSKEVTFRISDCRTMFEVNCNKLGTGFLKSRHYISMISQALYSTYTPKFKTLSRKNPIAQLALARHSIASSHAKRYYSKRFATEFARLRQLVCQDWLQIEKNCYSLYGPKRAQPNYASLYYLVNGRLEYKNRYIVDDLKKYKILTDLIINHRLEYSENWISKIFGGYNLFAKKTFLEMKKYPIIGMTRCVGQVINFSQPLNSTQLNIWGLLRNGYNSTWDETIRIPFNPEFTIKDIKKASLLYAKHTNQKTNLRKYLYLSAFCNYILDYLRATPNQTKCTLTGLVRKSIRWHRETRYKDLINGLDPKTPCKALTDVLQEKILSNKSVKFLSTVQEVADEGVKMSHCVAGYARQAIAGRSFLFHIERNGEQATLEVACGYDGKGLRVNQSRGPWNQINEASKWAEKYFNKLLSQHNNLTMEVPHVLKTDELPF